jgi:SAM-dependent methyltransferase
LLIPDKACPDTHLSLGPRREILWRSLWKYYFSTYVRQSDCVVELGCGYGHFINNVRARRRIAVDILPDFLEHLAPGIEGRVCDATELDFIEDRSLNFVFASNLIEHLTHEAFDMLLCRLKRKLVPDGLVVLLQPNYRYAFRQYFDDYTHISIYSHESLCDFLMDRGFEIVECIPKFLPLTIKSRLKVSPFLIWLYLHSPFKPFGRQMLVIARVSHAASR